MESASIVTFGTVMLIVSLIAAVAGILLLVFGIINTVKPLSDCPCCSYP